MWFHICSVHVQNLWFIQLCYRLLCYWRAFFYQPAVLCCCSWTTISVFQTFQSLLTSCVDPPCLLLTRVRSTFCPLTKLNNILSNLSYNIWIQFGYYCICCRKWILLFVDYMVDNSRIYLRVFNFVYIFLLMKLPISHLQCAKSQLSKRCFCIQVSCLFDKHCIHYSDYCVSAWFMFAVCIITNNQQCNCCCNSLLISWLLLLTEP